MDTTLLNTLCPAAVRSLIRAFRDAGGNAYPVGGCVRDALMGIAPHDWDVAVTTPPEETEALCAAHGWRTVPTGEAHGTITVLLPGEGGRKYEPVECTTCRTEGGYSDGRHPDAVTFSGLLSDDLSRRDFTVNAMAADLGNDDSFSVIDLFGGRDDLAAGVIRCVGDPRRRLTEDALRILRAVRFAARLGFAIHPDTAQALRETAPGLARISRERVRTELLLILCGHDPVRGVTLLGELGLLPYVLPFGLTPGADGTPALPHGLTPGADDTSRVTSGAGNLPALPPEDVPRLACLLAGMSADDARRNLDSLRLPNETTRGVMTLLDGRAYVLSEAVRVTPDDLPLLARRLRQRTGPLASLTADLLTARDEGIPGLAGAVAASEAADECVSLRALAVTGKDLAAAGIAPGRETGVCLARLLEAVIRRPEMNRKDILLEEASRGAD